MYYCRRLPHVFEDGATIFATWHLYGGLPKDRYPPPGKMNSGAAFVWMDRHMDTTRSGPKWLRDQRVAAIVESSIREENPYAYVIMPNHVHVLLTPKVALPKLMQSLKGVTARAANQILGVSGRPFWHHESYDHLVRSPAEFRKIAKYIEQNPVKAALAPSPSQYRWSSAWWRELQLAAPASAGGQ